MLCKNLRVDGINIGGKHNPRDNEWSLGTRSKSLSRRRTELQHPIQHPRQESARKRVLPVHRIQDSTILLPVQQRFSLLLSRSFPLAAPNFPSWKFFSCRMSAMEINLTWQSCLLSVASPSCPVPSALGFKHELN